jgi:5-methylcytosine-specific restriction enzyme A
MSAKGADSRRQTGKEDVCPLGGALDTAPVLREFPNSTQRAMPGGWVDREDLPRGVNGRCLCRWCNLEVPPGRLTFCSDWCVEEWKLRSNPGHLRERVFERDRGICAACGLNCLAEYGRIRRLRGTAKLKAASEWQLRGRKSLWDADHILPVSEGGGECDLLNMRTLCLKCHRARRCTAIGRL